MIKVSFVDFWPNFNNEDNFFIRLFKKHDIEFSVVNESPDFVICSSFGQKALEYDCPRIFFTGECQFPDFNIYDYAIGFDNFEFGDRYIRFPLYCLYENDLQLAINKHKTVDVRTDRKFCNFLVSNGNADAVRERFFYMLSDYKKVDSGGRYLNNIGHGIENKLLFQKDYKFSIAFENTSQSGYITEKILNAFAAGTVPIYWGAKDICKEFNPDAFINANDFKSLQALCEYVKKIDCDDGLFYKMLASPVFLQNSRGKMYVEQDYSVLSDFFQEIFKRRGGVRRNRGTWGYSYERKLKNNIQYLIPLNLLCGYKKVTIVGFGKVGQDYCKVLEKNGITLAAIADNNVLKTEKVNSLENAVQIPTDIFLIAVKSRKSAEEIKLQLTKLCVPENKILWSEPISLG